MQKCFDGDLATETWIAKGPYSGADKDRIAVNTYIQVEFEEAKQIGSVRLTQGQSAAADVFKKAEVQYSVDRAEQLEKSRRTDKRKRSDGELYNKREDQSNPNRKQRADSRMGACRRVGIPVFKECDNSNYI